MFSEAFLLVAAFALMIAPFIWIGRLWSLRPPVAPTASRPAVTAAISGYCEQRHVVGSGVRLRVVPGTASTVSRQLRNRESVQLMCQPLEHADDYDWLPVQGNSNATPGWVAAPYLQEP